MGPDKVMDPMMLTEHSGCPVSEGEKWITTFWMREGVTEADPWTHYDPSGVRMMDAPDADDEGNVIVQTEGGEDTEGSTNVVDVENVVSDTTSADLLGATDEL
jgi:hypothetical protein